MSDSTFTRASVSELRLKEQASEETIQELVRNTLHRVGVDGTKDYHLMSYLQGICTSLANIGLGPHATNVVSESDTDAHILVNCLPNERIFVFDILLSINAAAVISFLDSAGDDALAKMYAPNDGQGFVMNSFRGKPLKRGQPLRVQSDTAVSYSVDCSYAVINDEE